VPGTNTYAELVALQPDEFLRRLLEADDPRCKIIRDMRKRGDAAPAAHYEPPEGVTYDFGDPEPISENSVRVAYSQRLVNGPPNAMDEYEDLRRSDTGEWRLIARTGLLESRGSTATVIPADITRLIRDD
jgi:hypothetical protein